MKKTISLILAGLILLSSAACSSNSQDGTDSNSTEKQSSDGSEVNTEAAEEETELRPDLPDIKFDGVDFRYLAYNGEDTVVRFYDEVLSEEMTGEIMNDSIFERTQRIDEKYNVNIVDDRQFNNGAMYGGFTKLIMAGDDAFDVGVTGFGTAMNLTVDGKYLTDLNTIDYVDLSEPWWSTRLAQNISLKGMVFNAIGAMNTWADSHSYGVVFNKELAAQFDIDPYSYVLEDKWTMDTFDEQISKVTADINGDGVMDVNDRWGACGAYENFSTHMIGCNVSVVEKDENDLPVYNVSEYFYNAADKVCKVLTSGNFLYANEIKNSNDVWTDMRNCFREGKVVFYVGGNEQLLIFRDLDTELGLIPLPKYDESQEQYAHGIMEYWATTQVVPITNSRHEMTGIILEAVNSDSYYTTAVDYFEVVMKYKAMRDQESYKMLEIIRSTRTIDFEYAFGYLGIKNMFNNIMTTGDTGTLSSSVEKAMKSAEKKISKTLESIAARDE